MEKNSRKTLTTFTTLTGLAGLAFLSGCAGPTVNLATSDPIKVDIDMRLDVYQYEKKGDKPGEATPAPATDPKARRDNRMADIQDFKNNHLVGEGKDGLLVIQQATAEEEPDRREYIRTTVTEENSDRMTQMQASAEEQKIPLPDIQAKQAELWRNRSFKGEWIEKPSTDGGWEWIQKEG